MSVSVSVCVYLTHSLTHSLTHTHKHTKLWGRCWHLTNDKHPKFSDPSFFQRLPQRIQVFQRKCDSDNGTKQANGRCQQLHP